MEFFSVESYMKDKIDWKFFNAILDRLVKYKDIGINCQINVEGDVGNECLSVFKYREGEFYYSSFFGGQENVDNFIERFKKHGSKLNYLVIIQDRISIENFYERFACEKYGYESVLHFVTQVEYSKSSSK